MRHLASMSKKIEGSWLLFFSPLDKSGSQMLHFTLTFEILTCQKGGIYVDNVDV